MLMKNQRYQLSKKIFMGLVIILFLACGLTQNAWRKRESLIVLQSWQLNRAMLLLILVLQKQLRQ